MSAKELKSFVGKYVRVFNYSNGYIQFGTFHHIHKSTYSESIVLTNPGYISYIEIADVKSIKEVYDYGSEREFINESLE